MPLRTMACASVVARTSSTTLPPGEMLTDSEEPSTHSSGHSVARVVAPTAILVVLLLFIAYLWRRRRRPKIPDHLVPRPFTLQAQPAEETMVVGRRLWRSSQSLLKRLEGQGGGGEDDRTGWGIRRLSSSATPRHDDSRLLLAESKDALPLTPQPNSADDLETLAFAILADTLDADYLPDLLPESPLAFMPHAASVSPRSPLTPLSPLSPLPLRQPSRSQASSQVPSRSSSSSKYSPRPPRRPIRPLPPIPLPEVAPLRPNRTVKEGVDYRAELRASRRRAPGDTDPVMPPSYYWHRHRWYEQNAMQVGPAATPNDDGERG